MLLKNCRVVDVVGLRDVRIEGSLIDEIGESLRRNGDEKVFDASGSLLTSSLAEPHAHLDKAFLAERIDNPTGDLMGAITAMESNRKLITIADTIERAERAVHLMVKNGVTAIRTHADVTEWNNLDSVEALVEVKRRTSELVDMQICALLGWPLSGSNGKHNRQLGRSAIGAGADLLGGCPHIDEDPTGANVALLELAGELDCDLDLHTDEHTDANRVTLEDLAERVMQTKFRRSVTASHCVSLAMQSHDSQARIAEKVAAAGISVIVLPHTNLFLQGREATAPQPRGLTAVSILRKSGVRVAIGADNLQDPFNPIGRGDPLESAGLAILAAHLLPQDAFDAVSTVARQVMGLATTKISVGQPANLMLNRATSLREAIAVTAERPMVIRNGVVVSSCLAAVN